VRLKDKVCLITGAGSGIGAAYASRFASEGAIVAVADIDLDSAKDVAKKLTEAGSAASAHYVDIANLDVAEEVAARVVQQHGRIDVLVNNAAMYRGIDLVSTSDAYLESVLQVNLIGLWKMSRAVVPHMIREGGGKIVNQSSDSAYAYWGHPMESEELPNFSYGLSKWGVNGLTKFMATVLGKHQITVNCISPGVILTQSTKDVLSAEMIEGLESNLLPLGRSLQPEEVTGSAVFFASSDADLITGQILCVDAGMFMPG
jgi:NAD(P)-dependent dehydrogenase (short-subunit alcohol dehydrogenase family)